MVSATPVDMFPHTPHCELVMLLERVKDETVARGERVNEKPVAELEEPAIGLERGLTEGVERVKEEVADREERVKEEVKGEERVKEEPGT